MFDWNDIRVFLAVAESGSTLGASKALGISQSTAARRVAALEAAIGQRLFDRLQSGYRLTANGAALLPDARQVAAAAEGFASDAGARARALTGTVRLTTTELYATEVLPRLIGAFRERHPGIRIELLATDRLLDLARGEADIALRAGTRMPTEPGLVGRRVGYDSWTIYCSKGYAREHGIPRGPANLNDHALLGGGGDMVWPEYLIWLKRYGLESAVVLEQSSPTGLLAALRAGIGISIMSTSIGDADPELIQCMPPLDEYHTEVWLLTHERLRSEPRVRAVIDYLAEAFSSRGREASVAA